MCEKMLIENGEFLDIFHENIKIETDANSRRAVIAAAIFNWVYTMLRDPLSSVQRVLQIGTNPRSFFGCGGRHTVHQMIQMLKIAIESSDHILASAVYQTLLDASDELNELKHNQLILSMIYNPTDTSEQKQKKVFEAVGAYLYSVFYINGEDSRNENAKKEIAGQAGETIIEIFSGAGRDFILSEIKRQQHTAVYYISAIDGGFNYSLSGTYADAACKERNKLPESWIQYVDPEVSIPAELWFLEAMTKILSNCNCAAFSSLAAARAAAEYIINNK